MKKGVDYIGVGAGCLIINEHHQVLLLHRTGKSQGGGGGYRSRPGGGVDFGDTIEETAIREVKEELGVDVELFGPCLYANDVREEDGIKKHWFTGGRFAKIVGGVVRNVEPKKHDKIERFDLDNLPENINIYTLQSIEEYQAWLNGTL